MEAPDRVELARGMVEDFARFAEGYSRWAEIFRGESGMAFLLFGSGGPDLENTAGVLMVPFATACPAFWGGSAEGDAIFPDWRTEDPELAIFDPGNELPPPHRTHPFDVEALRELAREASVVVPTFDAAVARIDWKRKQALFREEEARREELERDQADRARRERIACEAQHVETMKRLEGAAAEGLDCPKCGKRSRTFRVSKHRDTSLICPACARSFYLVEPPPKPT